MRNHHQKRIRHKIMTALCIGAPAAGMLLLLLNRSGAITFGGSFLPYLLFLFCPLSHLLMMPVMAKKMNGGKVPVPNSDKQQRPDGR